MVDAVFEDPRLAALYDWLDGDRSDLDAYAALVADLGARSVLDVGCGTGTFACRLARRGFDVTGVDPAAASLAVARTKRGAELVRWVHGDVSAVAPLQVDVATMTGNVAQVFVTDAQWDATLRGVRAALRPDGWLVFETRDPAARAWAGWTPERSRRRVRVPRVGVVECWHELTGVGDGHVSFRSHFLFRRDGSELSSASTLRFRTRVEGESSLSVAGFAVHEVRQAP